ncbi:MAG: aldehyde dehydrogenase family protein, partial [Acidobacteriota bacterium]
MINLAEFRNESYRDFTIESHARAMSGGIERVDRMLGRDYPVIIGGRRHETGDLLESVNPSRSREVVGRVHRATRELADVAIRTAATTFESWKRVPATERAGYLFKA